MKRIFLRDLNKTTLKETCGFFEAKFRAMDEEVGPGFVIIHDVLLHIYTERNE